MYTKLLQPYQTTCILLLVIHSSLSKYIGQIPPMMASNMKKDLSGSSSSKKMCMVHLNAYCYVHARSIFTLISSMITYLRGMIVTRYLFRLLLTILNQSYSCLYHSPVQVTRDLIRYNFSFFQKSKTFQFGTLKKVHIY